MEKIQKYCKNCERIEMVDSDTTCFYGETRVTIDGEESIETQACIHCFNTAVDLLTTAFEGGSNYWYADLEFLEAESGNPVKYEHNTLDKVLMGDLQAVFTDFEDQTLVFELTQQKLYDNLPLFKTFDGGHFFREVVNENWDANTADAFLQIVCLGEIVYG